MFLRWAVAIVLFLAATGHALAADAMQRVTVHLIGCSDCRISPPGVSVWDEGQDTEIVPSVSDRNAESFVLQVPAGYYRMFLHTTACSGDRYMVVLPRHDRDFDITLRCRNPRTPKNAITIVRLVDAIHAVAGTIPSGVRAVTLRGAGVGKPFAATVSGGAYYADEWSYHYSVLDVYMRDGRHSRIAFTGSDKFNVSMTRRDISDADIVAGLDVKGSPFEVPGKLVDGPEKSVWVLDSPGNRVTVFRHGRVPRKINLPTEYADASDIAGTRGAVWVSERRTGKIARFLVDGPVKEFAVARPGFSSFSIGALSDGRILYWAGGVFGIMDADGNIRKLGDSLTALAEDSDVFQAATGLRLGDPYESIVFAQTGIWHTRNYGDLEFIDHDGKATTVPVPVEGLEPRIFAVGPNGAVWFSDRYGNVIGSASQGGSVVLRYSTFGPAKISDMVFDRDGTLWIAEPGTNVIEHREKGLLIMPPGVHPQFLLVDSEGALWYSDPIAGIVGARMPERSWCYAFRSTLVRNCRVDTATLLSP